MGKAARKRCLNCRSRPATRPRGLCWGCFADTEVRVMYPVSTSRWAKRGVGNTTGDRGTPPAPTRETPGSEAKLLVLIARAEMGYALHHPDDLRAVDCCKCSSRGWEPPRCLSMAGEEERWFRDEPTRVSEYLFFDPGRS